MQLPITLLFVTFLLGCHAAPATRPDGDSKVATFLMFQNGDAQAAMSLYATVFPGARIEHVERYGADGPAPAGTVKLARFDLLGHRLMCSDSYTQHGFTFTPSCSLFVDLATIEQFDAAFAALSRDGAVMMPPGDYGFSRRFAWCSDRFGVSWQLNVPAMPTSRR